MSHGERESDGGQEATHEGNGEARDCGAESAQEGETSGRGKIHKGGGGGGERRRISRPGERRWDQVKRRERQRGGDGQR